MSTRPVRPAAAAGTVPLAASAAAARATSRTRTATATATTPTSNVHHVSTKVAVASKTVVSSGVSDSSSAAYEDRDFTPINTGSARPPVTAGNGAMSARRVAHATSTASAILKSGDSDDDDDAGGGEGTRRLNLASVLREAKAEAAAQRREIAENDAATENASNPPAARASLAGGLDVEGPPSLPPQADEDNDLFYCPRLTREALERITGQEDLTKVSKLALHLNTEEQELSTLNTLLPNLHDLHLIPPSFVSSFRDFGRSLINIRKLVLPSAGLTDLDGIEFLTKLVELRAPENRIEDLSPLMFAPSLEILDLSHNKIKERDMIEFIGVCTRLKDIYLEGNPISMCIHYRSIIGSRCTDLATFQLDSKLITEEERQRMDEKEEIMIDKFKLRTWQEKTDRDDQVAASAQAALQRKVATADFNTLSTAPRPNVPMMMNGVRDSFEPSSPTAYSRLPSSSPSSSSSVIPSSTSSPASLAARKKAFQAFLDSKDSNTSASEDSAQAERQRRKAEKTTAIMDIMRLENEMRGEQASGVAQEYVQRMSKQREKEKATSSTASAAPSSSSSSVAPAGVPRLHFDAAFSLSSPTASPSPAASASHTFAGGFSNAMNIQQQYSLSTPRPSSSAGGRPGSSAGMRPSTASGVGASDNTDASDLTYGSDAIMAGGYAKAMRDRKKTGSISLSHSHNSIVGTSGVVGDSNSRSPSSTSRSSFSGPPQRANASSRSSSPAPGIRPASGSYNSHTSTSNHQANPSSHTAPTGSPAHHSTPVVKHGHAPILPSSGGGSVGLQPSRPLVGGSGSSSGVGTSSMLQRHLSGSNPGGPMPVGSPLAAARAAAGATQPFSRDSHMHAHASPVGAGAGGDEVVFQIPAKKAGSASALPSGAAATATRTAAATGTGKTYTLIRSGSNKK